MSLTFMPAFGGVFLFCNSRSEYCNWFKVVLQAKSGIQRKTSEAKQVIAVPLTMEGSSENQTGQVVLPVVRALIPRPMPGSRNPNPYLLINVMYLKKISYFTLLVKK